MFPYTITFNNSQNLWNIPVTKSTWFMSPVIKYSSPVASSVYNYLFKLALHMCLWYKHIVLYCIWFWNTQEWNKEVYIYIYVCGCYGCLQHYALDASIKHYPFLKPLNTSLLNVTPLNVKGIEGALLLKNCCFKGKRTLVLHICQRVPTGLIIVVQFCIITVYIWIGYFALVDISGTTILVYQL